MAATNKKTRSIGERAKEIRESMQRLMDSDVDRDLMGLKPERLLLATDTPCST